MLLSNRLPRRVFPYLMHCGGMDSSIAPNALPTDAASPSQSEKLTLPAKHTSNVHAYSGREFQYLYTLCQRDCTLVLWTKSGCNGFQFQHGLATSVGSVLGNASPHTCPSCKFLCLHRVHTHAGSFTNKRAWS